MQTLDQFNRDNYILTIERDIKSGCVSRISQLSKRCTDLHFSVYSRLYAMMQAKRAK